MVAPFVHLHLHTQYSLLDGIIKISDLFERVGAMGQPAVAMTDHGNLHGAIEFYQAALKAGIKPIIGCELYVSPGSRFEKKPAGANGATSYHLTVLAKDNEGYRNLCRLVTAGYREGFYFKPRVDRELLQEYNKGLFVLSGCLAGELAFWTKRSDLSHCREVVEFYSGVFKDRYYLEIQPHQIAEQHSLNTVCAELGQQFGIPLVATNDCHYLNSDDAYAQEVMMCIATGKRINDPDRMRYDGLQLHLKSAEEMQTGFEDQNGGKAAIAQTLAIANSCEIKFDFSTYYMPRFKTELTQPFIQLMADAARAGLDKRIAVISSTDPKWDQSLTDLYRTRLEEEIGLIDKMGFAGYFLVVADFIVWAKENGIPVGPGRGSVAGSLVAYAMRITEIDPIKNRLFFERFLNPERVSLPDIDIDFCINGRDRVIKYVIEKYGKECVAQIGTFGTLKAKAAIKDVGRVLGIGYAEADRIAQLIPAPRQGFDFSLAESIKMEPRLEEYAKGEGKEVISLALKVEGLTRHCSTHAAGVVIGDRPLTDFLPLLVDKEGNDVTQFSMNNVEKIGLVKFDFLGLKTLTVINTALRLIKENRGVVIDLDTLGDEDPAVFELVSAGNTTGVFQLESSGITDMTMRLKPSCFDDLVAILALYRPGPLDAGMVDHYIERKHGREPVSYLHPAMEEILADTYGVMVFQEQIMQLGRVMAGYSLGEADLLRKAMGKKIPEEMAKQRQRFIEGAFKKGISQAIAGEVFNQMETFARYGFNRGHTAAYALISYQTAYLKAHYNVEFMAALMSHEIDDSDKVLKNLNECRKQGIAVLPPDANYSSANFTVQGEQIRYGLSAVKGIGEKAVAAIERSRLEKGNFEDLEDFAERVDLSCVNKRVVENLIKCGAFDFSDVSRREMIERVDDVMRAGQSLQRQQDTNQMSLFQNTPEARMIPRKSTNQPEWPINRKLAFEREALGFYISGHPLEKFKGALKRMGALASDELRLRQSPIADVCMGGVVTALKLKNTRKGDRYATFGLEDWIGSIEAIVWPDVYRKVAHLLTAEEPVVVYGRLDVTDERCTLIVDRLESLIDLRDRIATQGLLKISGDDELDQKLDRLFEVVDKHSGKCPLKLLLEIDGAEVSVVLRNKKQQPVCVAPSEALCDEIEQLFGKPVLNFTN